MEKTRRDLRPVPLDDAFAALAGHRGGQLIVTMSEGQWDVLLSVAYKAGAILLELDEREQPVRAYQQAGEPSADEASA